MEGDRRDRVLGGEAAALQCGDRQPHGERADAVRDQRVRLRAVHELLVSGRVQPGGAAPVELGRLDAFFWMHIGINLLYLLRAIRST